MHFKCLFVETQWFVSFWLAVPPVTVCLKFWLAEGLLIGSSHPQRSGLHSCMCDRTVMVEHDLILII